MSGYRSGAYPGGKATKQNTAGQQNINAAATTTSVTAGNATFGSWVQITASTSAEFYITAVALRTSSGTALDSNNVIQIGIGGSGSESVIAELSVPLTISSGTLMGTQGYSSLPIPHRVASGQRVAVRAQNSTATPAYGVAVFGVPYGNVEGN